MLTENQKQTLAAALRAETDPGVVAALAIRNDVVLTEWCNAESATDAWNQAMSRQVLFESMNITKFDNLLDGKRDAWRLIMDYAPADFTRQKMRKAVQDIWGDTDSIPILQDCRRKATHAEVYLGGSTATTNTVSALKLNVTGTLSITEVSTALNRF